MPSKLGASFTYIHTAVGADINHTIQFSLLCSLPSSVGLCALCGRWKLQFIKSEFEGQLPKPFSTAVHGTRVFPSHMNDANREEPSRYVSFNLLLCIVLTFYYKTVKF